jgi:isoleucyl-tRNA synthetase
MSFTADETLEFSPKRASSVPGSVHTLPWPLADKDWTAPDIEEKFKVVLEMRGFVLKALDEQRKSGKIGSGLQAKVVIATASDRDGQYFSSFKDILASLFIVSQVELQSVPSVTAGLSDYFSQTEIQILPADGVKCVRCWNWRTDVGQSPHHPALCARCAGIVEHIAPPSSGGQ